MSRLSVFSFLLLATNPSSLASILVGSSSVGESRRVQEDEVPQARMLLLPFEVRLDGTPRALGVSEVDAVHSVLESTISDYFMSVQDQFPTGTSLDYVLLGLVSSRHEDEESTTTISIANGVVSFLGDASVSMFVDTPSDMQVNQWVKEAVNTGLLESLSNTPYYYVEDAVYVDEDAEFSEVERGNEMLQGSESSDIKVGAIVGPLSAGVVLLGLLGMLLIKRRRNNQEGKDLALAVQHSKDSGFDVTEVDDAVTDLNDSMERSSPRSFGRPLARNSMSMDGKSISDSEEEWTVATETGDSLALKSVAAGQNVKFVADVPVMSAESFERERNVNLRKDMLTTPWSGQLSANRAIQAESVLQPSHFVASEERLVRRRENHHDGPDPIDVFADDAAVAAPKNTTLVFQEANSGDKDLRNVPQVRVRSRPESPELV